MREIETTGPLWPRVILAVIAPLVFQLFLIYLTFEWAERDSSAAAFYPLAVLLLMAVAIPTALVANYWMIQETRHWHLIWVTLIGHLQAVLIPAGIVIYFLV